MSSPKKVLVTGANSGIGLALCKQLALEDNCHVFLGSRSEERGKEAVASILSGSPEGTLVELVIIDVSDNESVKNAAKSLENHCFHAIVNNAGIGLAHKNVTSDMVMDVNLMGAKRVNDAFLPLVDPVGGRLVGTSSGVASSYMQGYGFGKKFGATSMEQRAPLKSFDVTWNQIMEIVQIEQKSNFGETEDKTTQHSAMMSAYGCSKAALTAYYMLLAKENPKLVCSSLSPGFIATPLTAGFGASLRPEEGTVSLRKCILQDLGVCKGWYYGSDGLRSPIDVPRNPGEPEFQG